MAFPYSFSKVNKSPERLGQRKPEGTRPEFIAQRPLELRGGRAADASKNEQKSGKRLRRQTRS